MCLFYKMKANSDSKCGIPPSVDDGDTGETVGEWWNLILSLFSQDTGHSEDNGGDGLGGGPCNLCSVWQNGRFNNDI